KRTQGRLRVNCAYLRIAAGGTASFVQWWPIQKDALSPLWTLFVDGRPSSLTRAFQCGVVRTRTSSGLSEVKRRAIRHANPSCTATTDRLPARAGRYPLR